MAAESTANTNRRAPGGRTTPVLVPQAALAGRPDIPLDRAVTSVGSSDSSRLHLVSRTVSRSHALLINSGGGTYVADLASRTGVLVNGKTVRDAELKTGDRVQIGKFLFRYRSPGNAAPTPRIEPPPAAVIVVGSPAMPITGRVTLIGRRETSDVAFPTDAAVSAAHAVIFQVDGNWVIRDLGSRTGTLLNAKSVHQQALKFGDRLQVGSATILFQPAKAPVAEPDWDDLSGEPTPVPVDEQFAVSPESISPESNAAEPVPAAVTSSGAPTPITTTSDDTLIATEQAEADELPPVDPSPPVEPVEAAPELAAEPIVARDPAPIAASKHEPEPEIEPEPLNDDGPIEIAADSLATEEPAAVPAPFGAILPVESAEPELELASPPEAAAMPEESPAPVVEIPELVDLDVDSAAVEVSASLGETLPIESGPQPAETVASAPAIEPIEDLRPLDLAMDSESAEPSGALDETLPIQPAAAPPSIEITAAMEPPEPVEPVQSDESTEIAATAVELSEPSEFAVDSVQIEVDEPVLSDEIPTLDAAAAPVEPVGSIETDEVSASTIEHPAPIDIVNDVAEPEQSTAVEEIPLIESAAAPVEIAEAVAPTEKSEIAGESIEIEEPVSLDESAIETAPPTESTAPDSTPAIAESAVEPSESFEVAGASVETEEPVDLDEMEAAVESPEPVDVAVDSIEVEEPSTTDDLPDVIFWGDPELDADAEQAILAGHDMHSAAAPASTPTEPTGLTEPSGSASSFAGVPDPGDSIPEQAGEANPATLAELPQEVIGPAFEEPVEELADPLGSVAVDEISTAVEPSSSISAETVLGDESTAAVENFSPEVAVTLSSDSAIGESAAVVNEFITGDLPAFEDGNATVTESITTGLPDTEELLSAENADAPIEGLEELSAADAQPAAEEIANDLEWIDDASPVEAVADLTLAEETAAAQPVAEAISPVAEVVTPAQALEEGTEDDLEFLDFGELEPEPLPENEAADHGASGQIQTPATTEETGKTKKTSDADRPSADNIAVTDTAPAPEPQSRAGPSLFGFDFEGGSFLGGMPLQLNAAAPVVAPPAAAVAGASAVAAATAAAVFDVTSKAPSGLGGKLTPPPTARSRAPKPPAPAMPGNDAGKPTARPMTPPRPPVNPAKKDATPLSLTGLGADNRSAWSGPPEIPPTSKENARPGAGPDAPRPATAAGAKPVSLDVFSQMSAPIGIEVFGGRPGNPANIQVPDSKENLEPPDPAHPGENGTAAEPSAGSPASAYAAPHRRSKIPLLLLMLFVFPIALFGAVFSFVPSTAKIVGTLKFQGGLDQNSHTFGLEQIKRLRDDNDDNIRSTARAMLLIHKIPPGFTDDRISYSRAMDSLNAVTWDSNVLRFEYNSVEYPGFDLKAPRAGAAQVTAVLTALQSKDQDLNDIQARARIALDNAEEAHTAAQAAVASLEQQRNLQRQLAQDTPGPAAIDQLDDAAAKLKQQWSDAKTIHDSSAAVLADLRGRDPGKPVDIAHDPQVVDLQHQIDQLNDQIARSRSSNGAPAPAEAAAPVAAGSAITASTTQPADADPLVAVLQQQADKLNIKLRHRKDELAADAALTPEQRSMNLQAAIENMSIKLTTLDHVEADAKEAYDQAARAANTAHTRAENARAAGARLDDLTQEQITAEATRAQTVADERDKQAAFDACITVAQGSPISAQPVDISEPQWPIWAVLSALVAVILSVMIYGEAKRPALIPGVTPASAPLVNPPLRAIPWPQPHQLEGLNGKSAKPQEEPGPYIGI